MVSIIMPAYNAGKYIEKAIDSILKQSFCDFELIIINDGSTDNTLEICEYYKEFDKRVNIYSQNNGGICSARNFGLSKAKGEYITFCDNDDTYEIDLLKDNVKLALLYNADIVRWNFTTLNGGKKVDRQFSDRIIMEKNDIIKYYPDVRKTNDAVWNGLFKKEFLDKRSIRFNENMRYGGEDLFFSLNVLSFFPTIVLNSKSYYNWYLRENHSTSTKRNSNFCDSMLINADFEYILIKQMNNMFLWKEIGQEYYNYILSYASEISLWKYLHYKRIIKKKEWAKEL